VEAEGLSWEVIDQDGDHLVMLRGELDLENCAALGCVLTEIAHSTVVVDLRGLTFIDAAGLNALVRASQVVESRGDQLRIVNPSKWIKRVFQIGGASYLLS
jgi:anti-sigma B factor antagonist